MLFSRFGLGIDTGGPFGSFVTGRVGFGQQQRQARDGGRVVGHQLGAVGAAFMCAAADQAPGFIDAETGEDMEESLTAEEVKAGILSGK